MKSTEKMVYTCIAYSHCKERRRLFLHIPEHVLNPCQLSQNACFWLWGWGYINSKPSFPEEKPAKA